MQKYYISTEIELVKTRIKTACFKKTLYFLRVAPSYENDMFSDNIRELLNGMPLSSSTLDPPGCMKRQRYQRQSRLGSHVFLS